MRFRSAGFALMAFACISCEQPMGTPAEAASEGPPVVATPPIDSLVSYRLVANWPSIPADFRLGEVAGVALDSHGHVFVFQRAGRGWDTGTVAPISEATVLQFDGTSGQLLAKWGAGRFRLPHGLSVDANNNIWLTDAALHQVFKFSHDGELRLTLGEAGIPRWDVGHFNRPTDVAVRADGGFYVTDGYEAQRIVQFDAQGRYVREWGRSGFGATDFRLPHGIALKDNTLLIADRENGRLAIYDTAGVFQEIVAPLTGTLVYAVATEPGGGTLIALQSGAMGGIIRVNSLGQITHGLGAVPFGSGERLAAHDLAAGADGSIYVAETRAGGLRKYLRVAQPR
jgi:peptidylamidoglycolate lyase